ncbi:MAG: sugar ABC transporter substrate-binding protein [Ignavibacteria bacterium]|nr:sugar ABC transporter substrate-binding protein [Ignavibacteria bacterium]
MLNKLTYIFLLLLIMINGCADNKSSVTVIDFWAMGAEGEYVQKLVPAFEKLNPGIKVKVQMVPWTAAQEKLITAFASNNLPDAFQLGNTWIPQFSAIGAIDKLDGLIETSKIVIKENYFDGIWETNVLNGYVYGVPWYIDTRLLYYRSDILKKVGYETPPKTWEELFDVSKKIKENFGKQEKYPIYLPTNEFAPFVIFGLQNKATILKDNDSYGNFSQKEFVDAFKYAMSFYEHNLTPLGISQVTNIYQAFRDEYITMYISGPWNIKEFQKWMTGVYADSWNTAPLPSPDDTYPGLSLAGGASLVVSKNSKNKEKSWRFIEYLSQKETQLEFYNLSSDLPAVKSLWEEPLFKENKYMSAFYQQFQRVVPTPKVPEWEQIAFWKIQQYAELTSRKVLSVEDAMKKLDAEVNNILEKRRWLLAKGKNQ